jgi:hypothetical protein
MTRACDAALPSLREGEQEDPGFARLRAPFTREFPGLAPSGGAPLTPAERQHALDVMLPEMRLTPLPQPTPEFRTPTTFRHWCIDVLKPAIDA